MVTIRFPAVFPVVMAGRSNEEEAELFRRLYPGLRRLAGACAPVGVGPDDLVQEAVARTLRRGPLTDLDHPEAYLRRSIVNLAANGRRTSLRRDRALRRHGVADAESDHYPSDLTELRRLDPLDRAVLYLSEVERRPFDEVAGILGTTEAAARQLASRARRRLRVDLEENQ